MASEYWNKWWDMRSDRRRFLKTGAATGVGAAGIALVGCGDDDDDDDATNTPGGLAPTNTPVPDATATPTPAITPGGELINIRNGDPPSINPYGSPSFEAKTHAAFVYSRLYKLGAASGLDAALAVPEPDAAEGHEFVDNTTVTVKLRPDVMFHDVSPVSGRQMTTEDVEFSWGLATADDNANAGRLTSVVDRVEFTDDTTMTFHLKQPDAEFIDLLADTNLLYLMPKEADGGFDPATQMIGSGPWLFNKYEPSVQVIYDKNPNWFAGEGGMIPYADRHTYKIIPEAATRLAQFLAGNINIFAPSNNDLPQIVQQMPDVQLSGQQSQLLSFFYWSNLQDTSTPWSNPMVRQAVSMAMDRDSSFDLHHNANELADAGIDMPRDWNNIIPAGMKRWWLDPQSPEHGDSGKYFNYDPTEAKALLAAAGYDDPSSLKFKYQYTANRYGAAFNSVAEANALFLNDIGISPEIEIQDYNSVYFTQTFTGNFTGLAYGYETPFPNGGAYPQRYFTDNNLNHSRVNDTELADLTARQQQELDEEARRDLFHEIQRKNAEKGFYFPQQSGAGTGFVAFPKNVNYNDRRTLFYGGGTESIPYWWIDTRA